LIDKFTALPMIATKLIPLIAGKLIPLAIKIIQMITNPNKIKEYLISDLIPNLFKQESDNFRKSFNKNENLLLEAEEAEQQPQNTNNDEKYFAFIDSLLNKDTGVLGKQGIGLLFNDRSLQGDKMKVKRITMEYIIGNARDQVIKVLKYDKPKNIERNEKGFVDMNYLPSFKQIIAKSNTNNNDRNNLIENVINWINTNIRDVIIKNINAIREDDITAYVKKFVGNISEYKIGDLVSYKMKGYDESKPQDQQKNLVGSKNIERIQGDNYIFKDKNGAEFTKTKEDILGKVEGNENDGNTSNDLDSKISGIKKDQKKMDALNKLVNVLNSDGGVDKINKLIG
jgi:hypothetical protein